jgi:hypothetical protein
MISWLIEIEGSVVRHEGKRQPLPSGRRANKCRKRGTVHTLSGCCTAYVLTTDRTTQSLSAVLQHSCNSFQGRSRSQVYTRFQQCASVSSYLPPFLLLTVSEFSLRLPSLSVFLLSHDFLSSISSVFSINGVWSSHLDETTAGFLINEHTRAILHDIANIRSQVRSDICPAEFGS